jgi:hypothetical protein
MTPEIVGVGAPGLGGMQVAMLVLGAAIAAGGLLLGRLDGRFLIAGFMTLVSLSGLIGLATLSDTDVGWMLWQLKGRFQAPDPLEIHQDDAKLGWVNRPGAMGIDRHYDYRATYHIDELGNRGTNATSIAPYMLCLGCSFTFGQGVEDGETYPAQLQLLQGESLDIQNAGVNGWGTVQAMLLLERILEQQDKPKCVTYGFIPVHANRNSDRASWLEMLAKSGRKKPVLRSENGVWLFDRLVSEADARKGGPALDADETILTFACVQQMNAMCQRASIPFVCLMLGPDRMPETPQSVTLQSMFDFCREKNIETMDFTDLASERFPHDGHPTASWHKQVAQRLNTRLGEFMDVAAAGDAEGELNNGNR